MLMHPILHIAFKLYIETVSQNKPNFICTKILTIPSVLAKSFKFRLTKTSVFNSPMAISTSFPRTSLTLILINLTLSDLRLNEASFTLALISSKSLAMV